MRTVIVFNNPNKGSQRNTIVQSGKQRLRKVDQEVDFIDLKQDGFNPAVLQEEGFKAFVAYRQIIDYKTRLKRADHLTLIFPAGWNIIPAAIRGIYQQGTIFRRGV